MVKDISILNYDYILPEERIPKHPFPERDECRLLLHTSKGEIYHKKFKDLPDLLPPACLLVWNDTKVINARLIFHKDSGAVIEIFLLEPVRPADYEQNFQEKERCTWKCLVGNLKKWKEGFLKLEIPLQKEHSLFLSAEKIKKLPKGEIEIEFTWNDPEVSFSQIIEAVGSIPIPPYLNRDSEEADSIDYQTVFALRKGSVAAPTAGLHFTPRVIDGIKAHGVDIEKVTLHVGAGTFRPVKDEKIGAHEMHSEPFTVTKLLIEKLWKCKKEGRPIVATGTTTVRTLESLPYIAGHIAMGSCRPFVVEQWEPYDEKELPGIMESLSILGDYMQKRDIGSFTASTSIMIAPGFPWRLTDVIITNFHQPRSTLLLLVSSFIERKNGADEWKRIYETALDEGYRFLSYGDAMLLVN
ncbi:MAG: S-adenosylmethionine:tRNA ribosyltransferase-isomerase [Muribaculaceae bacterium]|nr:S-adenosylmethionine:tRNA ribosyltransferase-isomerase [Muribaculaceae bacterium]